MLLICSINELTESISIKFVVSISLYANFFTPLLNNNLEQQAQAIYQQMFVENASSDWKEGCLSDIADITMGQSPSGSSYNEDGIGTIFFQGRAEFGFRFPSVRLFTTEPKRMACANDTLMSVRAPVGDLNVAHTDCCIGRGLAAIHSKTNHQSLCSWCRSSCLFYCLWLDSPQFPLSMNCSATRSETKFLRMCKKTRILSIYMTLNIRSILNIANGASLMPVRSMGTSIHQITNILLMERNTAEDTVATVLQLTEMDGSILKKYVITGFITKNTMDDSFLHKSLFLEIPDRYLWDHQAALR